MDNKDKDLGFSDFLVTKYGYEDDYIEYRRKRLKNGAMHEAVEEIDEAEVDEVLSVAQRMKASQRMKKMAKRIQMGKKRAMRRAASTEVLTKRAKRQARNQMAQKLARGQSKSELSPGRRAEIEKRLDKMKPRLDKMAKRLVPQMRKLDRERRSGASKKED